MKASTPKPKGEGGLRGTQAGKLDEAANSYSPVFPPIGTFAVAMRARCADTAVSDLPDSPDGTGNVEKANQQRKSENGRDKPMPNLFCCHIQLLIALKQLVVTGEKWV